MTKRIIITGGSGFIGQAVTQMLLQKDYEVIILSRNPDKHRADKNGKLRFAGWDAGSAAGWADLADGAAAIINLAGENIGSGYWTESRKKRILESRKNAGHAVTEAVKAAKRKPEAVIQASAVGAYGSRGDGVLDESAATGSGFLSRVTDAWEHSTRGVGEEGVRQVVVRLGIALGEGGLFIPRIKIPFLFFVGGHLGSGEQWISWIHRLDIAGGILFLLEQKTSEGVYNLTSPHPVKAKDFYAAIGKQLHRPSWLHIPAPVLKLIFGEMAEEMFLPSQRVVPRRLQEDGFGFQFGRLEKALSDIFSGDS